MKNSIKYFYNIDVDDIQNINGNYLFSNYYLIKYYKKLDVELYNYMINNKYKIHEIIYNKDHNYITLIDNKPYILLKLCKIDKINLSLILNNNIIQSNISVNWAVLWEKKIDFYEKNISNIKEEKITKYFDYYVGLSENAISLFKTLDLSHEKIYISHIRIDKDIDYYNPLNIIVDYKMRDVAEYIKNAFFQNKKLDFNNLILNLSYNDSMLLFIRLLFPTYFFDNYDNYIKNEVIDDSYITHIYKYELFLKNIYKLISQHYNIPKIEWFIY